MPRQRNPKGIGPRVKDAKAYEQALRVGYLDPFISNMRGRLATVTAVNQAYQGLQQGLQQWLDLERSGLSTPLIAERLQAVNAYNRSRFIQTLRTAIGVDIRPFLTDAVVNAHMVEAIAANVELIKTIPPRFHDGLRRRIGQEFAIAPFDQKRLMELFQDEFGSTNYNLRRLTRDQTQKMNANLNEYRQRDIGVTQYIWRTSEDERVRPTHSDNNGKVFDWVNPPLTTGHPGQDVQCRCNAEPIITPDNRSRLGG